MPDERHGPDRARARRGSRVSRRELVAAGLGAVGGLLVGGGGSVLLRGDRDPRGGVVDLGDPEELHLRIETSRAPVLTTDGSNLAVVTWDPSLPDALDVYGGSGPVGPPDVLLDDVRGLMAGPGRDERVLDQPAGGPPCVDT